MYLHILCLLSCVCFVHFLLVIVSLVVSVSAVQLIAGKEFFLLNDLLCV